MQWEHSLSSLGARSEPVRTRLCSLSLYIVKDILCFGSVTVVRYSATVYSLFMDKEHADLLILLVDSLQFAKKNIFVFL